MALFKNISTEYGTEASYWKISNAVFNLDGSCTITVLGFYTQSARNIPQAPMQTLKYTILNTDMETYFQTGFNLHDAYEYLKTTPEFSFASEDI